MQVDCVRRILLEAGAEAEVMHQVERLGLPLQPKDEVKCTRDPHPVSTITARFCYEGREGKERTVDTPVESGNVCAVAVQVPLLSLVVATVGRTSELKAFLNSLLASEHSDVELIIVDQNDDDRVVALLAHFEGRVAVRHLRLQQKGASSARNAGASVASGQWIGFPDDDCALTHTTLATLRRYLAGMECDVLSGCTVDQWGNHTVLHWPKRACAINRRNLRHALAESTMYIRRSLFAQVGGFDALFGPGGSYGAEEAVDLLRRLWTVAPGLRAMYVPDLCFVHANGCAYSDEAALEKTYRYSRARGACFARHWRSSDPRRVVGETAKHVAGSIIFRGLRRRSRLLSLRGYAVGFFQYQWNNTLLKRSRASVRAVDDEFAN